jgi:hypothetical protein
LEFGDSEGDRQDGVEKEKRSNDSLRGSWSGQTASAKQPIPGICNTSAYKHSVVRCARIRCPSISHRNTPSRIHHRTPALESFSNVTFLMSNDWQSTDSQTRIAHITRPGNPQFCGGCSPPVVTDIRRHRPSTSGVTCHPTFGPISLSLSPTICCLLSPFLYTAACFSFLAENSIGAIATLNGVLGTQRFEMPGVGRCAW